MFALTLSLLASMISVGYAASLPVVEQADINFPFVDTSPAQNLTWEEVSVPRPGANPATYSITCSGSYGVGLEARSCFNALSYTPRSDHQETWVNDGVVPPGIQGAVRLPILILSSKFFDPRVGHGIFIWVPCLQIHTAVGLITMYRRYDMLHQPTSNPHCECRSCKRAQR